jgi:hypothetical protein
MFDETQAKEQGDEEGNNIEADLLDDMLQLFEEEAISLSQDVNELDSTGIPSEYSVKGLRNKGTMQCGYNHLAAMKTELGSSILHIPHQNDPHEQQESGELDSLIRQPAPKQRDINDVLFGWTTRHRQTFQDILNSSKATRYHSHIKATFKSCTKICAASNKSSICHMVVSILYFRETSGNSLHLEKARNPCLTSHVLSSKNG